MTTSTLHKTFSNKYQSGEWVLQISRATAAADIAFPLLYTGILNTLQDMHGHSVWWVESQSAGLSDCRCKILQPP